MNKLGRQTITKMYKEMAPDKRSLGRNCAYQLLLAHEALDVEERNTPFEDVATRHEALLKALYELLARERP